MARERQTLEKISTVIYSGVVAINLPTENREIILPWGERIPMPEVPKVTINWEEKYGVQKAGKKETCYQVVQVGQETGARIIVRYEFEVELLEDVTEDKWEIYSILPATYQGPGVVFSDGKYNIYIPLLKEKLETEEEYNFLTKNQVFFSDRDGDSAMSDSRHDYFKTRIAYLADKLGREDPFLEKRLKRGKLYVIFYGGSKVGFKIKGKKVVLLFGTMECPTDIPQIIEGDFKNRHDEKNRLVDINGIQFGAWYKPIME